jgi:hypothetical protein
MAITAELDCIGRAAPGEYVAYVKLFKDGVLIDRHCVKYDPADEKGFKEEVGKKILHVENSTEAIKAQATVALADVVKEKQAEIAEIKANTEVLSK